MTHSLPGRTVFPGFMHIDTIPNRNARPAYLLRESVRVGKRVTKRALANLSALPIEQIEAIRRELKGEKLGRLGDGLACIATRHHGHVEAVRTALTRLGIDKLIDAIIAIAKEIKGGKKG